MKDLIDTVGTQMADNSAEGAASQEAAPKNQVSDADIAGADGNRGSDLLGQVGNREVDAPTQDASSAEGSVSESAGASEGEPSTVQNPDSWTKESSFKEIKKLREENKTYRLKFAEQLEKEKETAAAKIQEKEAEVERLRQAQLELDAIKAKEEDKKRSLEEKLQHRERKLAELETQAEARQRELQERMESMNSKLSEYEAEKQAHEQVYVDSLKDELAKIPDDKRSIADLIVKGAGDPRDALIELKEAKLKGIFDEKQVVVAHDVPGANSGARANKDRLEQAASSQRKSMSGNQKIKAGLDSIFKEGQPNNVFRTK